MTDPKLLNCVGAFLDKANIHNGGYLHEPSGIYLLRHERPSHLEANEYQPLICLVLQGAKEVGTNTKRITVRTGQYLIVSHALPIISRITEATRLEPYIALVFPVDFEILRSFASDLRPTSQQVNPARFSISLWDESAGMQDALSRYLQQSSNKEERRLLAPITKREIHARLLIGPHADMLQKLMWHESSASRIFQATQEIQTHLTKMLDVGALAQQVGMSNSAFFEHFKAVTGTTPLQYQKDLRLLRARDDLQTTNVRVSEIAFGVGYESSAQFSREYGRKFGRSPREERKAYQIL
ncbi:AraC family transcriptional regulator N-terminal domain-containing protein [Salinispirillum marinum]|uniref:AraC family transcriptional regulator N-terminal domain-containing protein n=2 Tax=Saccharospirillaceae TaxID=255527 RepID=A0ABV8BD33_9GAMM